MEMAQPKRYQLTLEGTGSLAGLGSKVIRIPQQGRTELIHEQICALFDVQKDSSLLLYELEVQDVEHTGAAEPLHVCVSLDDIVTGVTAWYANDFMDTFLATSKPNVLVDARRSAAAIASMDQQIPSGSTLKAPSSDDSKQSKSRVQRGWVRLLDAIWPKHMPR
jgi:hypothetical protein